MQPDERSPLFAKRQTKHIKTQKISNLERLDKAVWFIPPAVILLIYHNNLAGLFDVFDEGFWVGIATLFLFFLMLGCFYLPLMMLWRAESRTLKQNAIAQTTFPVLEDFEYYRDELTDISPATISMCVDFAIERDKDLTAQLLKYTMQGYIETDAGQITLLPAGMAAQTTAPSPSDRYLLCALAHGSLCQAAANEWAAIAHQEVLAGPYLAPRAAKAPTPKSKVSGCSGCLGCLPFFIMIGLITYLAESPLISNLLALPQETTNGELLALMAQQPQYLLAILLILVLFVGLFASMMFPFSHTIAGFIRWKGKAPYRRTEQGDILAEEIYGLKNFIHDFSDLAHAQKETLVLWDDFLLYAVLLEENESIVAEITAMRNLNIITPTYTN